LQHYPWQAFPRKFGFIFIAIHRQILTISVLALVRDKLAEEIIPAFASFSL
jgi:hypothetical protein